MNSRPLVIQLAFRYLTDYDILLQALKRLVHKDDNHPFYKYQAQAIAVLGVLYD